MYKKISDEMFINEIRLLWQNGNRSALGKIIRKYFGLERAEPIINKMQEKIEEE